MLRQTEPSHHVVQQPTIPQQINIQPVQQIQQAHLQAQQVSVFTRFKSMIHISVWVQTAAKFQFESNLSNVSKQPLKIFFEVLCWVLTTNVPII